MDTLVGILTELSSIIGVPATIALAWAAFIIREQGKKLEKAQADIVALRKEMEESIKATSERFEAALRETVAKFEEKLDNIGRDQKQELGAIYKRIDDMAQNVAHIKGYLFRKMGHEVDPVSRL